MNRFEAKTVIGTRPSSSLGAATARSFLADLGAARSLIVAGDVRKPESASAYAAMANGVKLTVYSAITASGCQASFLAHTQVTS